VGHGRSPSHSIVEDVHNLQSPSSRSSPSAIRRPTIPSADDLYPVGCAARVLKALKHSSGNYSLILQGLTRIRFDQVTQTSPVHARQDRPRRDARERGRRGRSARDEPARRRKQVIQLMPELPREAGSLIDSIQAPGALADLVAANLDAPVEEKAQLIETVEVKERIRKVLRCSRASSRS
jgi:ATP-dependent Lon protease